LSSNTSKFTKIAQQRYVGRRSGKKEEESRIKLSPRPSPEKRRQNIAKKNKRGIEGETDSARDKAGVCPIRSWANNKRARGGRAATNEGFVGFFHSAKSSVLVFKFVVVDGDLSAISEIVLSYNLTLLLQVGN
jgi:hypothetical protein